MRKLVLHTMLVMVVILTAVGINSCSKVSGVNAPPVLMTNSIADKLAAGPVDESTQTSYYLLTDNQRTELLSGLRQKMTDVQIKSRPDIYAIIGHLFTDSMSVEEATQADRQFRVANPSSAQGALEYIAVGNLPQYSQRDSRWSGTKLGYSSTSTIGAYGCYLSCISDLITFWGYGGVTPAVLNSWSNFGQAHYAFSPGTDLINTGQAISYPYMCRPYSSIAASNFEAVRRQLRAGHPVVVRTSWGGGHFMLVYCWDGSRFWVDDPYPTPGGALHALTSAYGTIYEFRLLGYNPV